MSQHQPLRFFVTETHRCSYLPEQEAVTLFLDPAVEVDLALYSQLSVVGFRRSGQHFYRPQCPACAACIPVRIPIQSFAASRNLRRIRARNRDLEVRLCAPARTPEIYSLYQRYVDHRHGDGDMYPASEEQFDSFLGHAHPYSCFACFYLDSRLVMVAVVDLLADGLSAIYTFFDPDLEQRSLGTLAILWEIEEAGRRNLPYLYLGYWVRNCRKMRYKTRFQPLQAFINGHWQPLAEN